MACSIRPTEEVCAWRKEGRIAGVGTQRRLRESAASKRNVSYWNFQHWLLEIFLKPAMEVMFNWPEAHRLVRIYCSHGTRTISDYSIMNDVIQDTSSAQSIY